MSLLERMRSFLYISKHTRTLLLLIGPAVIYVFAIAIYPAGYGIFISLTNMRLDTSAMHFVGLKNYIRLFRWSPFFQVLSNSLIFAGGSVGLQIGIGLILALALNYPTKIRSFMRSLAVMPWAWPATVIGILFSFILNPTRMGVLNSLLGYLGRSPVSWLGTPFMAMLGLILTNAWRGMAFATIMLLAGLQTISPTYYEASRIDGAGAIQRFMFITLPLLVPILLIVVIMASAAAFNTVAIVMALTHGGPGRATEVIALSIYRQTFENYDAGLGASIAVFLMGINVGLTLLYLRAFRRKAELIIE